MRKIVVLFLLVSSAVFSQNTSLFSNPEAAKSFFEGKIYEVPGYGTLTFTLNKSATKIEAEKSMNDQSYDEQVKLVFDVSVKRNNVKKKDKGDYTVYMTIYLSDKDDPDTDPNMGYAMDFILKRQVIYPIKGFPAFYTIFSDGDLYYQKWIYEKYTFEEYKEIRLKKMDVFANLQINLIQCIAR